ncbi:MAG: hypothetical protein F9K27_16005 [Anaerolineae bacterium]|nr:MAG: hypothetical protein F9K27_16005 [Anaerolineae bacterium]
MMQPIIAQAFIGQISVVGECFAFGAALDGQQLVYLDVAGPATSVEAVWAKLAQGKETAIVPLERDTEKIVLRSAEGKLKRFERKVEGIGIYHLLLIHHDLLEPVYAELSTTYLFLTSHKDQTTAKLGAHIQALVDIAVFPQWFNYLVQQGRVEGLLKPLTCYGGVKLWRVTLDRDAWSRLICRGLQQQQIQLPNT